MGRHRSGSPLLVLLVLPGCAGSQAGLTFPEHAELHERAEYSRGAGAASHSRGVLSDAGKVAYMKELDEYLMLLRRTVSALGRLGARHAGARGAEAKAIEQETVRLVEDGVQLGRLVMEYLQLGAARRIIETIPEMNEAYRLAHGRPPAPGLDAGKLKEWAVILGTGEARCGARSQDPIAGPDPPPVFWVMARDSVDEQGRDVVYSAEQQAIFARVLSASRAQRQAMGQYGIFREISPRKDGGKGETWRFQIGSIEQSETGSRRADSRLRAIIIECDFDEKGELASGRERVLDRSGQEVRF